MNILAIVLAAAVGVTIDRVVIWDKYRAVTEERRYHVDTIRDLQRQLQVSNLERYANARQSGEKADPNKFLYTNPNFEQEFLEIGRARTHIVRGGSMQRSEKRPQ